MNQSPKPMMKFLNPFILRISYAVPNILFYDWVDYLLWFSLGSAVKSGIPKCDFGNQWLNQGAVSGEASATLGLLLCLGCKLVNITKNAGLRPQVMKRKKQ